MMLWLGEKRGYFVDWLTQRWVQVTGVRIALDEVSWLNGPVGATNKIGCDSIAASARDQGLIIERAKRHMGILPCFDKLRSRDFDPDLADAKVRAFYEHTNCYELDAWSQWSGLFHPLGKLVAALFSRRLQQLNVPLSPMDTARGITSEIFQIVDPATNEICYTAWVRQLVATSHTLYAAVYGLCHIPRHGGPCVRVVFPLPNGNAIVIMRPRIGANGALLLESSGAGFGDAGFYFTVQAGPEKLWVRYVPQLQETINVYAMGNDLRADHVVKIWGLTFLRLHYRMRLANNNY